MCGENRLTEFRLVVCSGSPPHVRGKHMLKVTRSESVGITPACAGKTRHLTHISTATQDHPRMCGEN